MVTRLLNVATALFTLCIFALPASASEDGFYGGVTIGHFDAEEQGISSAGNGLGVIAGYSFNKYFDVEASMFDAGDHADLGMKAKGFSLSVVGNYDISENWEVFAELGGISLDLDIDEATTTVDAQGSATLSDGRDSSLFYGYGVKYNVGKWSLFAKRALADTDADFDIFTLGATYHFR